MTSVVLVANIAVFRRLARIGILTSVAYVVLISCFFKSLLSRHNEKIERLKKAFRPKHKDDPSGEEGGAAGAAAAPQPRKQKPAKRRKVVG